MSQPMVLLAKSRSLRTLYFEHVVCLGNRRHGMFKRILILFCGVIMMCTATAASAATVTKLKNGLTVLIQEDRRFPLVSTRLYVHAGSGYEDPK